MKRVVCFILLAVMLVFPIALLADGVSDISLPLGKGDAGVGVLIVQNRLKQLGYFNFTPTGKYGDMTVSAVKAYQQRNGLSVTGSVDDYTVLSMFSGSTLRAKRSAVITTVFGKGQIASVKRGSLYDWKLTVDGAFPVGYTFTVTDYNTGTEFDVKRTGGKNHADVVPLDKSALQSVFGGASTWEKRACIVTIGDMRICASLFGNPNANGEYCLYFAGSTSDVSNLPDAEHEAMLLKANGQ